MSELEPYEATFQHIEMLVRRREKILTAQLNAESQVLHRAAAADALAEPATTQETP